MRAFIPSTNGEGSLINITVGWVRFARNGFCPNHFHYVGQSATWGRFVPLGGQGWIDLDEICILRLLISSFRSNPRSSPHYLRTPMLPGAPFGYLLLMNFSFSPFSDALRTFCDARRAGMDSSRRDLHLAPSNFILPCNVPWHVTCDVACDVTCDVTCDVMWHVM